MSLTKAKILARRRWAMPTMAQVAWHHDLVAMGAGASPAELALLKQIEADFPRLRGTSYKRVEKLSDTILTVEDFLHHDECRLLIYKMKQAGFAPATTKENGAQAVNTGIRNNDRTIFTDRTLAEDWLYQVRTWLPETTDVWRLHSVWPEFRCYRYNDGHEFKPHIDWPIKDDDRQSLFTLMVYLNAGSEFEGGRTLFYSARDSSEPSVAVTPAAGKALIFRQDGLLHSGEKVTGGTKYVLRTDVIYAPLD